MKKICKSIYAHVHLLFSTLISILSAILFSSLSKANKIKKLANVNQTTTCSILANGPSLRSVLEENHEQFLNQDLFVVNFFAHSVYFQILKPKYYVITDNIFFKEDYSENVNKLREAFNTINWDIILWIPTGRDNARFIKEVKQNRFVKIMHYNMTPIKAYRSLEYFMYKHNLGMPRPQNVSNTSIFLATNLHYKTINLYGADHSWLKTLYVNDDNQVCFEDVHFYDNKARNRQGDIGKLSFLLSLYVMAFDTHLRLQDYAQHLGVEILNHTSGSYIDAYKRVKSNA
jgi:hypothetical protein